MLSSKNRYAKNYAVHIFSSGQWSAASRTRWTSGIDLDDKQKFGLLEVQKFKKEIIFGPPKKMTMAIARREQTKKLSVHYYLGSWNHMCPK